MRVEMWNGEMFVVFVSVSHRTSCQHSIESTGALPLDLVSRQDTDLFVYYHWELLVGACCLFNCVAIPYCGGRYLLL